MKEKNWEHNFCCRLTNALMGDPFMLARQFARLLATAGRRPHAALGFGEVRRPPNARRAFPHH